jgi:hypothetical protein
LTSLDVKASPVRNRGGDRPAVRWQPLLACSDFAQVEGTRGRKMETADERERRADYSEFEEVTHDPFA